MIIIFMKLNLGCGGDYKKGYVNLDAFDSTIADKIMKVNDFEFDDNSVDEILLSQVIEHLGIVQSLYTISECFRVLKPSGKLIIKTPDIRSAFKRYLDGGREIRKNVLPWIFGVDSKGMQHRFCFPDDLLEETLLNNGFMKIKKDFFSYDKDEPVFRIVGVKNNDYQTLQFMSKFRKTLVKENLVDFDDQIPSLEKEIVIKIFSEKINEFILNKDKKVIDDIVIEGVVHSPKITQVFFDEAVKQNMLPREEVEKHREMIKKLVELKFPDMLLDKLTQMDGYIGEQEALFDQVLNFGREKIGILLNGDESERKTVMLELKDLSEKVNLENKIDFFSLKIIMLNANKMFQRGSKEFNLDNHKEAVIYFMKAEGMYRDQILTYWNLGRLHMTLKDIGKGISYYKKALSLIDIIEYENEKSIRKELEKEIRDQPIERIKNPLISLYEI